MDDGVKGLIQSAPHTQHVHAYLSTACGPEADVTIPAFTTYTNNAACVEKDSITLDANVTINSGAEVIYTARNGINLGSGFKVQSGARLNTISCPML